MLHHHESSQYHKFSVQKSAGFSIVDSGKNANIVLQLDQAKLDIIEANKKRLIPIVKSIIFCAHNNIPLRSHRDDGELVVQEYQNTVIPNNLGVFKNLLLFRLDSGDVDLQSHFKNTGKNCTMISKTVQNEIIASIGEVVQISIVNDIKKFKFYSILCDETTDISKKEQMTLCIRYVDTEIYVLKEEFLGFIEMSSTTGQDIKDAISKELRRMGLSLENLRGQGYDGGSNMAGKFIGTQALIKNEQPLALYTHCFAHCLNLSISKSCETTAIRNMVGIVSAVSTFLTASAKRVNVLEQAISNANLIEVKKRRLKALCTTCWVERHESLITFKELFLPISNALEQLESDRDVDTSSKAASLSAAIRRSDYIIALGTAVLCMSYTLKLSKFLQNPKQDLSTALSYVQHIKAIIKNIREQADSEFQKIYIESCKIALNLGTNIAVPRICNHQTTRNNINASNDEEYFRITVFIPFVDHIIVEIENSFDKGTCAVMAIEGIIPSNLEKYKDEKIIEAALFYEQDLQGSDIQLVPELKIWRHTWKSKQDKPSTAVDSLKECDELFFPNIRILLHLFTVLPVTTATAERSFSALKRLKSYLRSTMSEERLNGLALPYININVDHVITMFSKMKPRRIELSNWFDN